MTNKTTMANPSKTLTSPPTAMPNSMEVDGHGRGQASLPADGVFRGSDALASVQNNCSGRKRLRSTNHDDSRSSSSRPRPPPSTPTNKNANNRQNSNYETNVNYSPVIDVDATTTDFCTQQQQPTKSSPAAAKSTSSITTFTFPVDQPIISTLDKPAPSQASQDYEAARRRELLSERTVPTESTLFNIDTLLDAIRPFSISYNDDSRSRDHRKRPFTRTLLMKSEDGTVLARLPLSSTETSDFIRKYFPQQYGNKSHKAIAFELAQFYEESGRYYGCAFEGGVKWEVADVHLWFCDIGTVDDNAEALLHSIIDQVRQRLESPHWSGLPDRLDLNCRRSMAMIASGQAMKKLRAYGDEKVMIIDTLLREIRRSLSEKRVGGKASRAAIVSLFAKVFADMREDADVPVYVSNSDKTLYIEAKLNPVDVPGEDTPRILADEISKKTTISGGGAKFDIHVYPNSETPWVESVLDVATLLLPKIYDVPETKSLKNHAAGNIMMEAVNQAAELWQEKQVAKIVAEQEEEVHIPNEIVNMNILPFLTEEYQLPECYRFGCTNTACGVVCHGDISGLSHLRCGESGCEDICAWNNGTVRCTAASRVSKFCGKAYCSTLSTMSKAAFFEERERKEADGEMF